MPLIAGSFRVAGGGREAAVRNVGLTGSCNEAGGGRQTAVMRQMRAGR